MPKVKLCSTDKYGEAVRTMIGRQMGVLYVTRKELSARTGIPYTTLLTRLEHPQQFRLSELAALDRVLHFSQDQKAALLP